MSTTKDGKGGEQGWQQTLYEVIFKADTPAGKAFDVALLAAILLSIGTVMLSSVESVNAAHGRLLRQLEWGFTVLFSIEYILRLVCLKRPGRYAVSFFGIVDFLAVVPTYLGLFLLNSRFFPVVRILRMLRVFRILKLSRYVKAGDTIWSALKASRQKIAVFLMAVLALVVVIGTLMYLIEGPRAGFTSIPRGIYWAVVTMTTVGYGDITPLTVPGQMLAALVMILGYSIIAVPTGIMTVEYGKVRPPERVPSRSCPACGRPGQDADASYCKSCGYKLESQPASGEDGI